MTTWKTGVYTQKGLALLAKLTQGSTVKITRAVVGTGYVDESVLTQQTAISGIKAELTLGTPSYPENGMCKLPVILTNEGVTTTYKARQIGIYVYDADEGEILYFISQSDSGTYVLSENELPGYSATWTFYFKYGQAINVEVNVDPSQSVSHAELEEVIKIVEEGVSSSQSGEVVTVNDTANLPFAQLSVYGKSTQNGTPTPDAPIEVVSIGEAGSVTVDIFGKNVLPTISSDLSYDGITVDLQDDGSFIASGTTTAQFTATLMTKVKNDFGGYVLSGAPVCNDTNCCLMVGYYNEDGWLSEEYERGQGLVIKDKEYSPYISISVLIRNGVTVTDAKFKPMISLDGGEYEKYNKQSITIALPEELRGVTVDANGNYTDTNGQQWVSDEVDLARGVYVQRIGKLELDDSLIYKLNSYQLSVTGKYLFEYYPGNMPSVASNYPALCDSFTWDRWANFTAAETGYKFYVTSGRLIFYLPEQTVTTVEDFATYMGEHPATVYYQLANPIETALTDEEIAAYKALTANNPTTTVLNDLGAGMTVDCIKKENEAAFDMVLRNAGGGTLPYAYGTEDLTPGVSELATGTLYFVYE